MATVHPVPLSKMSHRSSYVTKHSTKSPVHWYIFETLQIAADLEFGQVGIQQPETGCLREFLFRRRAAWELSNGISFAELLCWSCSLPPWSDALGVCMHWFRVFICSPFASCIHIDQIFSENKSSHLRQHKLCWCECLYTSRERNFLLHKSNIVFISLHTNFFFRFSFTYTFLYQRKKSSLVCCFSFLLFFSSQLAALKHSQNLSTGVSHSTSDRGTVKTDNYFTFNFYFCSKFPSSSLSFNSNSSNYRVIGGTEN